jgi:hypothetical protein
MAVVPARLSPDPRGHGRDVRWAAGIDAKDWPGKAKRTFAKPWLSGYAVEPDDTQLSW